MIVKCKECSYNISSEAVACPSCGYPQQLTSAMENSSNTSSRSISRLYGFVALIAFLMSNFIPAILAPLVVLVSFVFSTMAIIKGGKKFGGFMFALCLLQTWIIADHFDGLSGSLGLTNPIQIEHAEAKKYSNVTMNVPTDFNQIIQEKCAEEWPGNYRMIQYCHEQQQNGVLALKKGRPNSVGQEAFVIIRGKCSEEWPRDFRMRAYCEGKQFDSYRALQASNATKSQSGACAQKWPDDFQMRQYCESKR